MTSTLRKSAARAGLIETQDKEGYFGYNSDDTQQTTYTYYDDLQLWIMQHFPDSVAAQAYRQSAAELAGGVTTYQADSDYYSYIYTPPAGMNWQTVAVIGPPTGSTDPDIPETTPEYYASWSAGPQTAIGTLDLSYGLDLHKIGLVTGETIDEATFEITPSATSGSIDGGSWSLSPAGSQSVTTGSHVMDDT